MRHVGIAGLMLTLLVGCSHQAKPEARVADTPFCERAADYVEGFGQAFDHVDDPQEFRRAFVALGTSLDGLDQVAPESLRDDLRLVRQGYGTYRATLERYDYEVDRIPAGERTLQDPKVVAANQRVETFLEKDCGIGPDKGT